MTNEMSKRIEHTTKLVPESQRELFAFEIKDIIDLAVAEERKRIVEEIKDSPNSRVNGLKSNQAGETMWLSRKDIISLINKTL